MNVAILGASAKPERMAYLAQQRLVEHGHQVFPVSPAYEEILGQKTYASLSDIDETINTLTVYVSPDRLLKLMDEVIQLKPDRVILNPGSESSEVLQALDKAHLNHIQACTQVMLSASSF